MNEELRTKKKNHGDTEYTENHRDYIKKKMPQIRRLIVLKNETQRYKEFFSVQLRVLRASVVKKNNLKMREKPKIMAIGSWLMALG